jgi:hypothetical protein
MNDSNDDKIFSDSDMDDLTQDDSNMDDLTQDNFNMDDLTQDDSSMDVISPEIAVDFTQIKEKLSKINNDLLYGSLDNTNDSVKEYEELFKNKDEVYINNTSQIFVDIKNNMYNTILKERNHYKKIYDIVEEYIIKNKLLVSNLYKISNIEKNIDSLFDYYYIVYCEISLIHANNIINNIFEEIKKQITNENKIDLYNADDPSTAIKFLNLKTLTKNEEFSIDYNNRTIIKLYALQKYTKEEKIRVLNVIMPDKIDNILYIPAEIEIIDVYQKIYNGNQQYLLFDDILFKKIKKSNKITGGNYNKSNKYNTNKYNTNRYNTNKYNTNKYNKHQRQSYNKNSDIKNSDIKNSLTSSYYEDDIEQDEEDKPKTCYEKKKDILEAIKIAFIKDFLKGRKDIMLIGANAYNWYVNGSNFCPNFDRLQIISNLSSIEIRNEINKFINDLGQKFKLSYGEELDLMIPKDFRTKRQVFSISVKTDKGMKIKPFLEYFNSAQFDIIPGMIKDDVLLGQKYVILRFLFIDIWIAKYVFKTGHINEELFNKRIARLWEVIDGINVIPMITDLFLGIHKDYDIAKKQKNIENDVNYLPYYPNSYYNKNKKIREIK